MKRARILIVEDEILIADTIKKYLESDGHKVIGNAISFDEAISLYKEKQPDLVLLDIRINGKKTGLDIGNFLNQQKSKKPFIYLTSMLDNKSIEMAKKTEPAGYLDKPVRKQSLLANVRIALHNYSKNNLNGQGLINGENKEDYWLRKSGQITFIKAEHIYVKVHFKDGTFELKRISLKEFMDTLPGGSFIQTHRGFAVNIEYVDRWSSQNIYIGDNVIPVSRSRRKKVVEFIEQK